jgi:hypothetical protein
MKHLPKLHLIKPCENAPFPAQNAFFAEYDRFIDCTNTENLEVFFRDLAKTFFLAGYEQGIKENKF